jgi:TrkA domain protein
MNRGVRVEETALPGIGVRDEILTAEGRRVGVVTHRSGRRDLVIYDVQDPDACSEVLRLTDEEADALAEVLGAPRIVERLAALHEQASALVTEQVRIAPGSPYDGRTLGDTRARTRTGCSIVAVLRDGELIPSPGPPFVFAAGDMVIAVGTDEGTAALAGILHNG